MKNWKYIEGAKTGNICSGNKNPDWDVGNYDWDVGNFNGQWYITKNGQKFKGPFRSMNEAARYLDGHKWEFEYKLGKSKTGNTQVGNDTLVQYVTSKPKAVNEDKTGAEEFFKKLSDDVKEREKKDDAEIKLVGNAREWEVKDSDVIEYINGDPNATKLQRICIKHLGTPDTSNVQALLVDEKSNKWAVVKRGVNAKMKVGNREVYINQSEQTKAVVYEDGTIMLWDKNGNNYKTIKAGSLEEARKKLNSDYKKVGNRVIEKESEMSQELKNLLKKAPEWIKEKIQYAFSHGFTIDEKDFINAIKKEVGNASVGNAKDKNGKELRIGDIVLVWTSAGERAGKVKAISGDRITVAIRNEGDWSTPGKLADKVSNSKAKNSAPDDKFAYVMREFDEGKLKTPDGKVVTDPAQAKAIAYSESKKTENGLARARNAMAGNGKTVHEEGPYKVVKEGGHYIVYKGTKKIEEVPTIDEALDDIEVWLYGND